MQSSAAVNPEGDLGNGVVKIEQKITAYSVVKKEDDTPTPSQALKPAVTAKPLVRDDVLMGSTYKIKTPVNAEALYITINDAFIDDGSEDGKRVPFELFINSKNMEHFQWVVAVTRLISSVFRLCAHSGNDASFLVEELKQVFDPAGGFFGLGMWKGKHIPSLVANIGMVIEHHMKTIGLIENQSLSAEQQTFLNEKRAEFEKAQATPTNTPATASDEFPENATLCGKCRDRAVVVLDGCSTCLSCGDSKCQ